MTAPLIALFWKHPAELAKPHGVLVVRYGGVHGVFDVHAIRAVSIQHLQRQPEGGGKIGYFQVNPLRAESIDLCAYFGYGGSGSIGRQRVNFFSKIRYLTLLAYKGACQVLDQSNGFHVESGLWGRIVQERASRFGIYVHRTHFGLAQSLSGGAYSGFVSRVHEIRQRRFVGRINADLVLGAGF